jgi:transcriptional regulator with XRE-family HTH domain
MAKSKEKIRARSLRRKGVSIREIAKKLKTSKGSVSRWCNDIVLSKKQIEKLHEQMVKGSYQGRLKGAHIQKERKKAKIKFFKVNGKKDICSLKNRELFLAGISLYWGEGSKKSPAVRFYNSDFLAIRFMMQWFRKILKISDDRFQIYVSINDIHKERTKEIIEYWSKITKVPIEQFRKPILLKVQNKKVYENFSEHYGTLCIRISKSTDLFYQIKGWIEALSMAV